MINKAKKKKKTNNSFTIKKTLFIFFRNQTSPLKLVSGRIEAKTLRAHSKISSQRHQTNLNELLIHMVFLSCKKILLVVVITK